MDAAARAQAEGHLESARRALNSADRMNRIARQELARLAERLDECSAEGGPAHHDADQLAHAR